MRPRTPAAVHTNSQELARGNSSLRHPQKLTRREVLARASTCGWLAVGWPDRLLAEQPSTRLPPVPRINGNINVHPVRLLEGPNDPRIIPELVDLQLRTIYALGIQQIRTTISFDKRGFGFDFLGAIPYIRAARALGIDVLGLIGNFDPDPKLARVLADADLRPTVLQVYLDIFNRQVTPAPGVDRIGTFTVQVLNEPTHAFAIPPRQYVQQFLRPVCSDLKALAPELTVVSAAPVGDRTGVLRAREMFRSGLERYCDRVAFHVYDREAIPHLAGLSSLPVWITESSVVGPERHLDWVTRVYDEIHQTLGNVEHIFYYDLFDQDPRQFRLISLTGDETNGFRLRPESTGLLEYLAQRVEDATMGRPHARYETLIPDITMYFPTAEDHLIIDSADLS